MACGVTVALDAGGTATSSLGCCTGDSVFPTDMYEPVEFKPGMDVPPPPAPDPVFYHDQFENKNGRPLPRRPGGSLLAFSVPITRRDAPTTTGSPHGPATEPPNPTGGPGDSTTPGPYPPTLDQ